MIYSGRDTSLFITKKRRLGTNGLQLSTSIAIFLKQLYIKKNKSQGVINMYDWKVWNITKEELEQLEDVQIETVATIGEFYYADTVWNEMLFTHHWFTKEMTTLVKYYLKDTTNKIYYYAFVVNNYEIRKLTLSKDNWEMFEMLMGKVVSINRKHIAEKVKHILIESFKDIQGDDVNHLKNQQQLEQEGQVTVPEDFVENLIEKMQDFYIRSWKSKYRNEHDNYDLIK